MFSLNSRPVSSRDASRPGTGGGVLRRESAWLPGYSSCQVDAFVTNEVYEVVTGGRRFVVKASTNHDALRAEPWACARGADAKSLLLERYCPDPATIDELAWRLPPYEALWMLIDAVVAHDLGHRVAAAKAHLKLMPG
jgi:hypothetical protein